MPLRRFRSIRSSQRRNASDMRPFNKRLGAKVGGGIPLARDEAKSLSRLTRLLQSLYPVNTGRAEPRCPAGKMFTAQGPKDMPEPRELRRNDGLWMLLI